jgi:uncharacterized membrane protein
MAMKLMLLVGLTFVPALELRASIPWGLIDNSLPPAVVVTACILANIALAPIVWLFLDKGIALFLRVDWIDKLYQRVVLRARANVEKYVSRWGTLGLALFIGVPLPGSGVYSGALGAYLLGFGFAQYMIAAALGVLIAGSLVTAAVLTGASAMNIFIKH